MIRNVSLAILCWSHLFATLLLAQNNEDHEQLRATGQITAAMAGGVQIKTAEGDLWNVKLPMNAKDILYQAKADVDFLRPGMTIRFNTTINNKGQVIEEVGTITVFTPNEPTDLGLIPDVPSGDNPTASFFADDKEKVKEKPRKPPEQLPFYVGGQVVSIKGNKMAVSAGGTILQCKLAESPVVNVAVADLSYVQMGDQAEINGWYYANRKQLGAMANRITVTAAEPLVDARKKLKSANKKDDDAEKKSDKETKKTDDATK